MRFGEPGEASKLAASPHSKEREKGGFVGVYT
jgi:hypothetical protein